jgi:hypothetical protein
MTSNKQTIEVVTVSEERRLLGHGTAAGRVQVEELAPDVGH